MQDITWKDLSNQNIYENDISKVLTSRPWFENLKKNSPKILAGISFDDITIKIQVTSSTLSKVIDVLIVEKETDNPLVVIEFQNGTGKLDVDHINKSLLSYPILFKCSDVIIICESLDQSTSDFFEECASRLENGAGLNIELTTLDFIHNPDAGDLDINNTKSVYPKFKNIYPLHQSRVQKQISTNGSKKQFLEGLKQSEQADNKNSKFWDDSNLRINNRDAYITVFTNGKSCHIKVSKEGLDGTDLKIRKDNATSEYRPINVEIELQGSDKSFTTNQKTEIKKLFPVMNGDGGSIQKSKAYIKCSENNHSEVLEEVLDKLPQLEEIMSQGETV